MTESHPPTTERPEPPGPPRRQTDEQLTADLAAMLAPEGVPGTLEVGSDPPPGLFTEPLVTVEIETFATAAPKVRVRVANNSAQAALALALDTYEQALEESAEIWHRQKKANDARVKPETPA